MSEKISSWNPVIVDQAIFEFEPRPPTRRPYIPDTVWDGWTTEHLTLRMASVRGYSHRYSGIPRQDDAEVAYDPESGSVIFAVADGVSNAPYSHVGARVACQSTVESVFHELKFGASGSLNWQSIVDTTSEALMRQADALLNQQDVALETATACLGTTLIAGCIWPSAEGLWSEVTRVGDSSAWVLEQGRYFPAFAAKSTDDLISSEVSPLPRIPEVISTAKVHIGHEQIFLIGTDGFGDPLGDGDGMVGQLFVEHLRVAPPPRGFAHLLDFSRETFDDDRTLIGVWPISTEEWSAR
jgi:hypothetical protein